MMLVVFSSLLFLILFIWSSFFFFLMSLPKGLSILFIFSKNQLLDSLILTIMLLVSIHLILLWSWLFPPFYLLWVVFVVGPGVLVGVELGCLFEMFLSFLGRPVLLWTSLSGLPLLCPIGFGLLCVQFNLFPETFWFLPYSHSWPIHCLKAWFSISMILSVLGFFPLGLVSTFSPLSSRKMLDVISIFLNL